MISALITSLVLLISGGDTTLNPQQIAVIKAAIEEGQYSEAESRLLEFEKSNPENPEIHHLLGSTYELTQRYEEALDQYEKETALYENPDAEVLKKMASLNSRLRNYNKAKLWWHKSLALQPEDKEALTDSRNLSLKRSIHFISSAGGWEVDYTTNNYEFGTFIGWFDQLDLYINYSTSDKIFYNRSNISLDAYWFLHYNTYLRFGTRFKKYGYPADINPNPDNNSYDQVSAFQAEVGHYYSGENNFSAELEYFTPSFYWNKNLRADNFKLSASVRNWIVKPFYGKVYFALLRDPNPESVVNSPVDNSLFNIDYQTNFLAGGALGYKLDNLTIELKYLPDRDLDKTIDYSIFSKIQYLWDGFGVQYDFLYDRYLANGSTVADSKVNVLSFILNKFDFIQLRVGTKILSKTKTEFSPFIYLRVKTGF